MLSKMSVLLVVVLLFVPSSGSAADFAPTVLNFSAPEIVQYNFDDTTLEIVIKVSGTPANTIFLIYTKDLGQYINSVQNGFLGWHYVNKIDTCVYTSSAKLFDIGSNVINWDGKDQDGNIVPPGNYDYYLWGFDNISMKIPASKQVAFNGTKGIQIQQIGEDGMPMANPVLYPINYNTRWEAGSDPVELIQTKWELGGDPEDETLLETTSFMGGNTSGYIALQPDNHDIFYTTVSYDYPSPGFYICKKYEWVPNGEAIQDMEWGDGGEYQYACELPWPHWETGVIHDYQGTLYMCNQDISGVGTESELIYVDMETGEELRRVDLSEWWIDLADGEAGGQSGGGPTTIIYNDGYIFGSSHTSCIKTMMDPFQENDEEVHVWVNQNGDYVGDHNFEEESERPWICNDYNVPPWMYTTDADEHQFSIFNAYGLGAISFGLFAPDGTGIAYLAFGGESDAHHMGQHFVDIGSPFDGIYTDNKSTAASDEEKGGCWYVSHDSFRGVITASGSYITVLSPNGGEKFGQGSQHDIVWASTGIDSVKIEYSSDDGSTWNTVIDSYEASTGSYAWTLPLINSELCRVRVSDITDSNISDTSNAPFSIVAPYVTVTSPNGGEQWVIGTTQSITWNIFGVTHVNIEISIDGGTTWSTIIGGIDASNREYPWEIPAVESSTCLIRISDSDNLTITDMSDTVFSIIPSYITVVSPNGGEQWPRNSIKEITWISEGVTSVKLKYSSDNGSNWNSIVDETDASPGSYFWRVPLVETDEYLVRISDVSDAAVNDVSDNTFSVIPAHITLISPNGGESFESGSTIPIVWESEGIDNVSIEFSSDNGSIWDVIHPNFGADEGQYNWQVPFIDSETCLVKMSDAADPNNLSDISDGVFEIKSPPPMDPFSPTLLKLITSENVQYDFDGSELQIPVTVTGTPAYLTFLVYTKDQAASINNVQNGFLGWHFVNKIDTCLYTSPQYMFNIGENSVSWDGRDQDGGLVPSGEYTYYMWAYDNVNAKSRVTYYVNPSWDDMSVFVTHDSNGLPLSNPILYSSIREYNYEDVGWYRSRQKWIIGSDPTDLSAIETCSYFGWNEHCQLQVDPYNDNMFFVLSTDNNLVGHLRKYQWVPNGEAVLKTGWGNNGECTWDVHSEPGHWCAQEMVKYAENDMLVATNTNHLGSTLDSELVLVNALNGTETGRIDLSEWWVNIDDGEVGGQATSGPTDLEYRDGLLLLGAHTTCMNQAIDPHDENNWNRWVNRNGDYIGDHNFEEDALKPWVCNDWNVGPYKYTVSFDEHLFSVFPCYDMGAVSFGLYAPDGTGISYFVYAGETANIKYTSRFVDYGSAFDGIYTDDRLPENVGWWYIAHDSVKGVINPWGQPGWLVNLTVTEGLKSADLQFGVHPEATDGIDVVLGELELPPLPPSGTFDVRFIGNEIGNGLYKDLRCDCNCSIEYVINIQRAASGDVTITWESLTEYDGVYLLQDTITGTLINVDMKSTTEYTISNSSITQVKIVHYQAAWEIQYQPRWNFVSMGADIENKSVTSVFPTALSVYEFDNGYQQVVDDLELVRGYWVNLSEAYITTLYGCKIDDQTLDLSGGWHMIGALSNPVAIADIVQNPPNNIISVFKFDGVYQLVDDQLMPGEGYWLNLRENGSITMNSAGGVGKRLKFVSFIDTITEDCREIPLKIESVYGEREISIYIKDGCGDTNRMNSYFELPPLPPVEAFDVRIASENTNGLFGVMIDGFAQFETDIDIKARNRSESVVVRWDRNGLEPGRYMLSDGQNTVDMALANFMEIDGSDRVRFSYAGKESKITDYKLMNNYPNPFNPNTTISYSIKSAGLTKLTIYNVLGQEVRRLVDDLQQPGLYTVKWDGKDGYGKDVSGGLYLYQLKVNDFFETKKMLFMK